MTSSFGLNLSDLFNQNKKNPSHIRLCSVNLLPSKDATRLTSGSGWHLLRIIRLPFSWLNRFDQNKACPVSDVHRSFESGVPDKPSATGKEAGFRGRGTLTTTSVSRWWAEASHPAAAPFSSPKPPLKERAARELISALSDAASEGRAWPLGAHRRLHARLLFSPRLEPRRRSCGRWCPRLSRLASLSADHVQRKLIAAGQTPRPRRHPSELELVTRPKLVLREAALQQPKEASRQGNGDGESGLATIVSTNSSSSSSSSSDSNSIMDLSFMAAQVIGPRWCESGLPRSAEGCFLGLRLGVFPTLRAPSSSRPGQVAKEERSSLSLRVVGKKAFAGWVFQMQWWLLPISDLVIVCGFLERGKRPRN